jgi:hypothetical protein
MLVFKMFSSAAGRMDEVKRESGDNSMSKQCYIELNEPEMNGKRTKASVSL